MRSSEHSRFRGAISTSGRLTGFGMFLLVSQFCYVTRAMVHDRRVRRSPAPDPIPFVLAKWVHATSLRSRVMACWWIPAGVQICLRGRSFGQSRFGRLRPMLCSLEWVHSVVVYLLEDLPHVLGQRHVVRVGSGRGRLERYANFIFKGRRMDAETER